jgi:hypothetical protein
MRMRFFMNPIVRRALFAVAFIGLFFTVLRPSRDAITKHLLVPAVLSIKGDSVPVSIFHYGGPGFYIVRTDVTGDWQRNSEERSNRTPVGMNPDAQKNTFSFRGFGDKFFSLGAFYFLVMGFGWKPVGKLFFLHQAITVVSLICLLLAVSTHPAWLYPMNLLVTYITPAATGIFVLMGRKTVDV